MDFLYSDAFIRAVSTGAVALYQHLGPARHFLLRPVFGLCCNASGLTNVLFGRRDHFSLRELRTVHCRAEAPGAPVAFDLWTSQGTWFWYVPDQQRDGGTIGAAETRTEAIREARSSIEEKSARAGQASRPRRSLRSKNPI
jgi:hypothetical protein